MAHPALPTLFTDVISPWPKAAQQQFRILRDIVFNVADRAEIGAIHETLKWGQPSWLPAKKRVGSTLRCAWKPSAPKEFSLFVNCNTTLCETMRELHPNAFQYEGQRALHFPITAMAPTDAIEHCAFLTLTYHRKTT
ncbi:MAG: hypothetical protein ABJL72_20845 [Roseobacter sp.]